jgi:hypothetical protein
LQAPELEGIWKIAKRAGAIEFDLKQTSPLYLDPLLTFVRSHRGPELIVATRSVSTLKTLRREAPWVVRFLSIGHPYQLERLRIDSSLDGLVQGVSVRESLLDSRTTRWLKDRRLVVLAWIVDDVGRARRLVKYGVDGIATNDLKMIESLGRNRPDVLTAPRRAKRGIARTWLSSRHSSSSSAGGSPSAPAVGGSCPGPTRCRRG